MKWIKKIIKNLDDNQSLNRDEKSYKIVQLHKKNKFKSISDTKEKEFN